MAKRGAESGRRPVGVVDIGSNSIRLIVFEGPQRAPRPVFNEKVLCGLGASLERTGRLDPDGAVLALANLERFAALARAMGARKLHVLATAAVRDSADGAEFVHKVERRTGFGVRVLAGGEEARLSAMGVVSGIPGADGACGDLGGGSIELVELHRGEIGRHATLPFGPLRLRERSESRSRLREAIDEAIDRLGWLDRVQGKTFYAVGGAWRGIARLHMAHENYPLRVIHHYAIARDDAEEFLDLIGRMSKESLERMGRLPRKRLETLPLAALVLDRVLRRAGPKTLVFSALGLREGAMFDTLPAAQRTRDPLIAACEDWARSNARFAVDGAAIERWIAPALPPTKGEGGRLRLAACLLGDIAWTEHPDHRGEISYLRVLRMPLTGVDHAGRAFLALAVHTRYEGRADDPVTRPSWQLLDEDRLREAYRLGLALRLAFTLSGGAPAALARAALRRRGKTLELVMASKNAALVGESVERRLQALAEALGCNFAVKLGRR